MFVALTIVGVGAGLGLIGLGWVGDVGRGRWRRCPRCWYPMDRVVGRRCPECGHAARSEGALHRGRPRRWVMLAGVVVVGVSVLWRPAEVVVNEGVMEQVPLGVLVWGVGWEGLMELDWARGPVTEELARRVRAGAVGDEAVLERVARDAIRGDDEAPARSRLWRDTYAGLLDACAGPSGRDGRARAAMRVRLGEALAGLMELRLVHRARWPVGVALVAAPEEDRAMAWMEAGFGVLRAVGEGGGRGAALSAGGSGWYGRDGGLRFTVDPLDGLTGLGGIDAGERLWLEPGVNEIEVEVEAEVLVAEGGGWRWGGRGWRADGETGAMRVLRGRVVVEGVSSAEEVVRGVRSAEMDSAVRTGLVAWARRRGEAVEIGVRRGLELPGERATLAARLELVRDGEVVGSRGYLRTVEAEGEGRGRAIVWRVEDAGGGSGSGLVVRVRSDAELALYDVRSEVCWEGEVEIGLDLGERRE